MKKHHNFALLYEIPHHPKSPSKGHFRIITKMVSPETETQKARYTSGRSCPVANSRRANNCGKQMGKDLRRMFPKTVNLNPN